MPATYDSIASTTLASTSATITFSSISSSYTDLVLVIAATNTGGNTDLFMRLNNDTGTNYSYNWFSSTGSSVTSGRVSTTANVRLGYYALPQSTVEYHSVTHILSYTDTNSYTTWMTRANAASAGADMLSGTWRNDSAINRIDIVASAGAFGIGSTFSLYGIATA